MLISIRQKKTLTIFGTKTRQAFLSEKDLHKKNLDIMSKFFDSIFIGDTIAILIGF